MNFIVLPSLHEAAVVRIVSLLYNDLELENAMGHEMMTYRRRKIAEQKIEDKLSSLLPSTQGHRKIIEKVAKAIYPMHQEVRRWKMDHDFLPEHIDECCSTHLCWKMDGTINRTETAKKLVVNHNIDPMIRFILACTYFLEDEVVALWNRYEEIEKNELLLHGTNIAVRFWVDWLEKKDSKHWSEMIDEYIRNRSGYPGEIPLRTSCFYHLLSREGKKKINLSKPSNYHTDDFPMCVNRMNETERIEIFHSDSFTALKLCLEWPFRSLFLRMAKEAIGYLTAKDFVLLLCSMLYDYFYADAEDLEVFETFWQISPAAFKDEARNSASFISTINHCLTSEHLPQDFKENLRKCLNRFHGFEA